MMARKKGNSVPSSRMTRIARTTQRIGPRRRWLWVAAAVVLVAVPSRLRSASAICLLRRLLARLDAEKDHGKHDGEHRLHHRNRRGVADALGGEEVVVGEIGGHQRRVVRAA